MKRTIHELLKEHYEMKGCFSLSAQGERAFLLQMDDRRLIFKFHDPLNLQNHKTLNSLHAICVKHNIVPAIIPCKDGEFIRCINGQMFSLQEYIDYESCCPERFLEDVGKRLAFFHQVICKVQAINLKNHLQRTVPHIEDAATRYGYGRYLPTLANVQELLTRHPSQIVHGDVHKANLLVHDNKVYFIDLDSACSMPVEYEVIYASYRLTGGNMQLMEKFIESYCRHNQAVTIDLKTHLCFLVYHFLLRILFILIWAERGENKWVADLENQKMYLQNAAILLEEKGLN